jgi:glycine/D-amino acid oxidase-like deaminating enzyme
MMSAAQARGTELRHGRITGIVRRADGSALKGVEVDGGVVEADAVVVAMGPWSLMAAGWLVLPAVFGQRSPSIVYDTGRNVPADALFLEYQEESGDVVTVEVFPRADGSTLVTAFSDEDPLPLDPAAVTPDPSAIDRLQAICERLSPMFRAEKIIARQACFRPVTQDGLPLIGKVPRTEGAYVATGHNVWGILNAPATGEAVAELIADGVARSTDLTPFDPIRLRPLDPSLLRSR